MTNTLTVNGFKGHLLALNGIYKQQGMNHAKTLWKKNAEMQGTTECSLYYWDNRDGDHLMGWWMAPEVGGTQVWAYSPSSSQNPPPTGWKVPWNGPVDPQITMQLKTLVQGGGAPQITTSSIMSNIMQAHQKPMDPRQKAARERNLNQVNAGITSAENAVSKMKGADACKAGFDFKKCQSMASSSIANAQRCLDGHMKYGGIDQSTALPAKQRLQELQAEIQALQAQRQIDLQTKLEYLKTNAVRELTELIFKAESLIDKTKDAAAIFTCEMAEHIKPEDTVAAKEKSDLQAVPAAEALRTAKETHIMREAEMRQYPPAEVTPIRESIKPLLVRLSTAEKDLNAIKMTIMNHYRKAQQLLAKKKRADDAIAAQQEKERLIKVNKGLVGLASQLLVVVEETCNECGTDAETEKYREAEAFCLGIKNEVKRIMQDEKETLPHSRPQLNNFIVKMDVFINKMKLAVKAKEDEDRDKVRRAAVQVAVAAKKKQAKMSNDEYWAKVAGKSESIKQSQFERFIKTLGITCDCPQLLFQEACRCISAKTTELTKDEFFLHIMHVYYMISKPSPLQKKEDSNVKCGTVEPETVVEIIEGPKEVENKSRAQITYNLKNDVVDGWITIRDKGEDLAVRYSPHYVVLTETVLTDVFELTGFKVVRRIKPDEKVRALKAPVLNTESSMWRVYVMTEQDEKVWVTIASNRGTPLLKNIPLTEVQNAGTEPVPYDEEKMNERLRNMALANLSECQVLIDTVKDAKEKIEEKVDEIEKMDDDDYAIEKDEAANAATIVDNHLAAQKEASQKAFGKAKQMMGIQNIQGGAFDDVKEELMQFQVYLSQANADINALKTKYMGFMTNIKKREHTRKMAEELAHNEAEAKRIMAEVGPYAEKLEKLATAADELENRALPTLADTLPDFMEKMKAVETANNEIDVAAREVKEWVENNTPKSQKRPLHTAHTELSKHRTRCSNVLHKCRQMKNNIVILTKNLREKVRIEFSLCMKKMVAEKKKTAEEIFTAEFGADTVELNTFVEFGNRMIPNVPFFEEVVKGTVGSTPTIAKIQMEKFIDVSYRCTKRGLITDGMEIKSCKRLKFIEPEEIVEILQAHELDPTTSLVRIKGKASDGVEGYITMKGNKGSTYFKLQQNGYKVIKDTVFTDKWEMVDFKVLRRLKEGDVLLGLTPPQWEEKSGLWRMKAQALDGKENDIGWVTTKGSQGSSFLLNCEIPDKIEPREDADAADPKDSDANEDGEKETGDADVEMTA